MNKSKIILSLLLSGVLISGVVANATENNINNVGTSTIATNTVTETPVNTILDSGKCGNNVTWELLSDNTLNIKGSGNMFVYNIGDAPYYKYNNRIKKINISGVSQITKNAFVGMSNLSEVYMDDSVSDLGEQTFIECRKLNKVTLSKNISVLKTSFASTGFESFDIPDTIKQVEIRALGDCKNLKTININSNDIKLKGSIAYGCYTLEKFVINSDKYIIEQYNNPFAQCSQNTVNGKPIVCVKNLESYSKKYLESLGCICKNIDGSDIVEEVSRNTVIDKQATCTEKGESHEVVTFSDGTTKNENIKVIDELGHAWDNGIITKAATYEEDGVKTYTCSRCNETRTEVIPKLIHNWGDWVTDKYATVEQEGHQYRIDKDNPNSKEEKTIEKFELYGRSYNKSEINMFGKRILNEELPADCIHDGYRYSLNEMTNEVSYVILKATGQHKVSDWIIDKEATTTEDGHKYKKCTVCGTIIQEESIPKLINNTDTPKTDNEPQKTSDSSNVILLLISSLGGLFFSNRNIKRVKHL